MFYWQRTKKSYRKPLFRHLMTWLVAILLIVFGVLEFILLQHFHNHVTDDARKSAGDMSLSMHLLLKESAEALSLVAKPIIMDEKTREALKNGDENSLEAQWRSLFNTLREEHNIFHFSFFDTHRKTLLRLHAPQIKNDFVHRFVMLEAEKSKKMAWSLEVSKSGNLILRVAYPVLEAGECIGYVEFGKSIDSVFDALHVRLGSHFAVFINKSFLTQSLYEEYVAQKGASFSWNEYDKRVMVYSSRKTFPHLSRFFQENSEERYYAETYFDHKSWFIYTKNLHDAEGIQLGDIALLHDISHDIEDFVHFAFFSTVIGFFTLISILWFIYKLLHRTDAQIVLQQKKAQESEKRVKELATQSRTIFWEINAYGMFTYISEVEDSLTGYAPHEVENKMYFYDMYNKNAYQGFEERARWIFNAREPLVNKEDQLVTRDGDILWVLINASPLFDENGVFGGYRGILTDITKRKKAEEAQKEAMERLQKIASRIPGVVYQYRLYPDGRGCIPFASAAIYNIYRVTPEEVLHDDSKIMKTLHPEDKEGVLASVQLSADTLAPWRHEYRVRFEDGEVRWLFGSALPQREADGSILWYGFIDDITERKMMENELKALNEALDKRVEEEIAARTKIEKEQEIERQFLIQKSKLSSMGEMMGAIAHQWRQPLNVLNLNIQNLDDDFSEGKIDKTFIDAFIAKNKKTIMFMSKTIDDFRNFFKIDKAKQNFLIKEAIIETITLQSAQFKNRNIHIEILGEEYEYYGFRGEFQQVILNILGNAKDAILEQNVMAGHISIVLNEKRISIEDNAGGIDEAILERIFEPYFTTKEQGDGTGIGLYMSKIIIEKNMGGKLEVHNTQKGAKFTILLG